MKVATAITALCIAVSLATTVKLAYAISAGGSLFWIAVQWYVFGFLLGIGSIVYLISAVTIHTIEKEGN